MGATCNEGACRFVQPSSDIFNASTVVLGVLLLLTAYFLWRGCGSKALSLFEGLAGIGCIGAGTFNESYGGAHVSFSAFTFFSIGIQALLVFKVAKALFSYFSAATGVMTLAATVLYGTGRYLGLGQGGMERMVVYPVLIGGARVRRLPDGRRRGPFSVSSIPARGQVGQRTLSSQVL